MMLTPQETPQDLQFSAMKLAPPSAASNTQYLLYGDSSENPIESSVSTTLCLSSRAMSPPSSASDTHQYLLCGNSSENPKERSVSTTLCLSSREMAPPSSASNTHQCLLCGNSSETPKESLVSTTLCLSSYEGPNKRKRNPDDATNVSCIPSDNKLTNQERNIKRMKNLTNEQWAKDQWNGVSTELALFKDPTGPTENHIIKKVLTTSDLGHLSRLLLHTGPIENHIIKYLNKDDQIKIEEGLGITVDVYDHDTDSTYELLLKRWTKLKCYILNRGWRMYFVRRRGLRKGDEIGLFWDRFTSRFHFRVLSRASTCSVLSGINKTEETLGFGYDG